MRRCIEPGVKSQSPECEFIAIDNTNDKYKSAAQALNDGALKAHGEYLVFAHQDICIPTIDWMQRAVGIMKGLPEVGIVGVAGKRERGRVVTNITHGNDRRMAGEIRIVSPVEVQTVDECLMIIPHRIFNRFQFDHLVCDGWHLYGVDYSLTAIENGYRVYVLPLEAHHESEGASMSSSYFRTVRRVISKHGKCHAEILTTMGDWDTRMPLTAMRHLLWRMKKPRPHDKDR